MACSSSAVGCGVCSTVSATRSFHPVFSRTSSISIPGCTDARYASPSSPKRNTALEVITAAGPPRGKPTRLRQPGPSPLPGLVRKETHSGRRCFVCSSRTTNRCASDAMSQAPPDPGRRVRPFGRRWRPRVRPECRELQPSYARLDSRGRLSPRVQCWYSQIDCRFPRLGNGLKGIARAFLLCDPFLLVRDDVEQQLFVFR